LQLIASPDARDESMLIHQDAFLYQLHLSADTSASHALDSGRTVYVHVVSGDITVNGLPLGEGDGAEVSEADVIEFAGISNSETLVFDLP